MFRRVLKYLLIIVAVINLVLLFGFDYQIPSFLRIPFSSARKSANEAQQPEEETVQETEETGATEPAEEVPQEPAEEETKEEVVQRCVVVSPDGSNIRSGPGTNFDVITSYPHDTVLIVTGDPENGWYPIKADDGTAGYIFESQIRMIEDGESAEGQSKEQAEGQEEAGAN